MAGVPAVTMTSELETDQLGGKLGQSLELVRSANRYSMAMV